MTIVPVQQAWRLGVLPGLLKGECVKKEGFCRGQKARPYPSSERTLGSRNRVTWTGFSSSPLSTLLYPKSPAYHSI
jgi:hypothetical protein